MPQPVSGSPGLAVPNKKARADEWLFAHFCAIMSVVNGREFIARVRRLARSDRIVVKFDCTRGKGGHGTLYYGDRCTVPKDRRRPLRTGTLHGVCKPPGIDPNDL